MAAVNTIKNASKTLQAAKGESDHSAELRKQLGLSAGLAVVAGAIGFFALRAYHCATAKADQHNDWKAKDQQLDSDLADSLDASDAVAKY